MGTRGPKPQDLTGQSFGQWTVIKQGPKPRHWLCRCTCGSIHEVRAAQLISGESTRCRRCGNLSRRRGFGANFTMLYLIYRRGATKRDLPFELTREQFHDLTIQPCHYCGIEPRQVVRAADGEPYIYNGIDRRDNDVGYLPDNCLPCCKECNRHKGAQTYEQFVSWLDRIAAYRTRGGQL